MGVGFAIPVDMVKSVIESLVSDGRVVRGWLGVYIRDLDEPMSRSFGFDSTDGALVNDVPSDGPAAAAVRRFAQHLRDDGLQAHRQERLGLFAQLAGQGIDNAVDRFYGAGRVQRA